MNFVFKTIIVSTFVCSACATDPDLRAAQNNIELGMTKSQVTELLGEPIQRSFNKNLEALQYCETGMVENKYLTVWLDADAVSALTTDTYADDGICSWTMKEINWGLAPLELRVTVQ